MPRPGSVRRLAVGLLLAGLAAVSLAGCVLVPAPVPVAGPVVVAPAPVFVPYGYGYYGRGYGRRW